MENVSAAVMGLTLAASLGLVHILAHRLRWIEIIPHKRWLSFGAGVSIAYVFVDVLPLLSEGQEAVRHAGGVVVDTLKHHVYLLALVGLAVFYGLELVAKRSRAMNRESGGEDCTSPGVFWVHTGFFVLYNALLGYLLHESVEHGLLTCVLLVIALAFHFIVNDHALREHHKTAYDQVGRWILATSVLAGYAVGSLYPVGEATIAVLWGLVAGGLILNVMKEELPDHRESCFWSFVAGLGGYAALLISVAH